MVYKYTHTNLATLGIGGQQVYNLDSCDQNLLFDTHVCEFWCLSMDGGSPEEQITILNFKRHCYKYIFIDKWTIIYFTRRIKAIKLASKNKVVKCTS